jgi:polysaccharide deacetylase 2 family uncharacterized protein YibQ
MAKGIQKIHWPAQLVNWSGFLCLFLCLTVSFTALAESSGNDTQLPAIGIIIDDLGYLKKRDTRAIRLPGPVTYAFLPHTPHAFDLATLAHKLNKEVMLHLPMESMEHEKLGPGGLTLDMSHKELTAQLKSNLESVPHVVGINNHMGSLLTQHPGHMLWLMQALHKRDDLYFVDSYTTKTSIVQKIASENWVPNVRRDVFLDSDRDPVKIRKHFRRLLKMAKKTGIALGIGHPYPETMAILEEEIPKLGDKGIQLLPVSKLLNRDMKRFKTWRAFLYP